MKINYFNCLYFKHRHTHTHTHTRARARTSFCDYYRY